MIVELIITWFADAAVWLFGLLPDWTPPEVSDSAGAAAPVFQFVAWTNQYLPLDIALGVLGVLLVIWVSMFVYRVTVYVLSKLHILGGSSE